MVPRRPHTAGDILRPARSLVPGGRNMTKATAVVALIISCACLRIDAQDLVPDLLKVKGIEHYDGPASGKALLRKNGFVVVPRFYHRIFSPYYGSALPRFVTADSVHRTFHVLFEDQLKKVETSFTGDVQAITDALLADLAPRHASDRLTDEQKAAVDQAAEFLRVAKNLLGSRGESAISETVHQETSLIHAAAGVSVSPLFGYRIDYSQFKPRGFYTDTPSLRRYFMVMSWYGAAAFRLKSRSETAAAIELVRALERCEEAFARWRRMDRTYSHLISPTDDLSPVDYMAAINLRAGSPKDLVGTVQKLGKSMRDPRINSMALSPGEMRDWIRHSKGMRLFGKRYIPDSEVFMDLTDPKVPGRGFPSGLDIMAANGSVRARALMARQPASKTIEYQAGMEKAEALLSRLKSAEERSHYIELLRVAGALTAPPHKAAAAFAKTDAYADKSLVTALASWASLRHAWVLHAKQSVICLGIGFSDPMPGYVEPNPSFFEVMQRANNRLIDILGNLDGVKVARFRDFGRLLTNLAEMVRKELAGEPFTKDEIRLLDSYSNRIGKLQGFEFNMDADSTFPWMALVTDVHTEGLTKQCLQVGTGGAMPIYVIVEHNEIPHLLIGAVYSYYEFKQPIANRLADEEWRARWDSGSIPSAPAWTTSFVPGYDVETLLQKAREGEFVSELLHSDDARIDAFLAELADPGSVLTTNRNYAWLLKAAATRQPDKMVPVLLGLLRTGKMDPAAGEQLLLPYHLDRRPDSQAQAASMALARAARSEDVAEVVKMALSEDKKRARLALRTGNSFLSPMREEFLIGFLTATEDVGAAFDLVDTFRLFPASGDITPAVLQAYAATENSTTRGLLVKTLARAWVVTLDPMAPRPKPRVRAPEAEQHRWGREIHDLVMDELGKDDALTQGDAIELAGAWQLRDLVPVIAKVVSPEEYPYQTPMALAQIGTDAAIELLIRLSEVENASRRADVVQALGVAGSSRAVPRLRALLDDKRGTDLYCRVCDRAAEALSAIFPEGPVVSCEYQQDTERDKGIEKWRDLLKNGLLGNRPDQGVTGK